MLAVMTSLPTCPTCSGLIPHAILAAPFCPWCGKPRTPGASDDDHAKRVKVAKAARSGGKTKSESVLSEGHRHSHLAFDPQIGFAMIGAHKHDDAMHLRAYDLYNKRVAWEALSGEMARDTMERVAVRGHTVYANIGRTLRALDLFTGRQKWGSEFSDVLDSESAVPHRELKIVDTTPPGHPGAVIAFTIDKTIVSMDRDTGRPLWKEKREHMPRSVQPLEQSGLVLFQIHSHLHEVINPAQQALVLRVEKSIENAWLAGRFGLWKVRNWGCAIGRAS